LSALRKISLSCQATSRYADSLAKVICVPTAAIFFVILLLQVFFRYVLQSSLAWYTEAILFSYRCSLFMGFAIALKSASHIEFKFLFERLPPKTQRVVRLLCQILALSFFIFVIWGGYKHFVHMTPSMLPIMGISEKWAVLPVPLSALIMAIHVVGWIMEGSVELYSNDER